MNDHPQFPDLELLIKSDHRLTVAGVPDGVDSLLLADLVRARSHRAEGSIVLYIASDEGRASAFRAAIGYVAPDIETLDIPAWDCLPYDRVSPKSEISSRRMAALAQLATRRLTPDRPLLVVTTVNAVWQRVPTPHYVKESSLKVAAGQLLNSDDLTAYLTRNGYLRAGTVREPGDYAIRGGIIDLFPPGFLQPVRLDMFGDSLESIRSFDAESQRTIGQQSELTLVPVSELPLDDEAIRRFRRAYVANFGAATDSDLLYESISEGRKHQGMEHWLPLFHDELVTIFDYLGDDALIFADHLAEDAKTARQTLIEDYYEARLEKMESGKTTELLSGPIYKPIRPLELYLSEGEWQSHFEHFAARTFSPFIRPASQGTINIQSKMGREFSAERSSQNVNVFDAVGHYIGSLEGRRVMIACASLGSAERMANLLEEHGLPDPRSVDSWRDAMALPLAATAIITLTLDRGFEFGDLVVLSEQDILGDRLVRKSRRTKRAENFIAEASALSQGDLVVHVDHGIGRYDGLQTIDVAGAPHDCLLLVYRDNDKLYLPVENIELLSRFGSDDSNMELDRLGGSGWQSRKAKLKKRIRDLADQLIKIAAARELRRAEINEPPSGLYEEFCARFPFEETEDQERAIADVIEDIGKGRPMDRLVCGDVGFGKTEVALRSAFVTAMNGHQVAVVTPTTLLCRQHHLTFTERFSGWPLKVAQLSRLISQREAQDVKAGLTSGDIDIVIGTHALLAKNIEFRDLGLLIVDEEQHFGVTHKEQLKQLRSDVHVLTMTATPIPRTLQLAMSGVREMSLIATPPIDRLAVRTFVTPFDTLIIREALLRERYRGGQSFFVCPRISNLAEAAEFLTEHVPEVSFVIAHGQMAPRNLDEVMNAFYEGKYDVLVSTSIIESGLDIPTANTLIIQRADMFGLAQLYQLRGRIGRSKARAYAYLTVRPNRTLTIAAEKRLKVLQLLDSLGAGFSLASHDLDIRGAGNLLGEEQSGHIKEVGLELYQSMLEEAVASLRDDVTTGADDDRWSPQIKLGTSVLIPEHYIPDLDVRLALYRRLADLEVSNDIDEFAAELIDRFGRYPEEVDHLLEIVEIKILCRRAGVEKVEAGPKGVTLAFRNNEFRNPAGLIAHISQSAEDTKLRPDHRMVIRRNWPDAESRFKGVQRILNILVDIAEESEAA